MIRKLFLLAVMAVSAFALLAASASAVTVENPGMHEVEGENTLAIVLHPAAVAGEFDALRCENQWEANVTVDGHINIHDIDFIEHTGTSTANCSALNDCNDEGWEGQIEEGLGLAEFDAHLTFCLTGIAGELSNVPIDVECEITDTSAHCDEYIHDTVHPLLGPSRIEVQGEVFFHDSLELMH